MQVKHALALLAWSMLLAVVVLLVVAKPISELAGYSQQLERTLTPEKHEPYGGCDEAYLYPDTPGYRWCERNGYLK